MVEQVKNRRLFHLTETKPYKQALVAGQKVNIGNDYSPFFGFYEGAREYGVMIPNGVVQIKAVAWLRQVRDGLINIDALNLASNATDIAQHYVMLCREIIMEEIRRDEFKSETTSRQRCLYACDTVEEARYWKQFVGQGSTVCELTCTGTTLRADASWLLGDSEPLSALRAEHRSIGAEKRVPHPSGKLYS